MAILLTCSCGQSVPVEMAQAGGETACGCGQAIKIPSLSKLRELTGKGAYEAGVIDTINRMVASGELPSGDRCAVSGETTDDEIDLFVEAEQVSQIRYSAAAAAFVAILCSPLIGLLMILKQPRDVGRDTLVLTPLRVAAKYHRRVSRSSQRKLKRWLRTVPVYAQLLQEYPRARIVLHAPAELKRFNEGTDAKQKENRDPDFEI
jgi:hypothetical protein